MLISNSAVEKLCLFRPSYVHETSLKARFVAGASQSTTGLVFVLLGLVGASPCWPVLGLAIAVVDPFNCRNAEWLECA